MTLLFPVVGLLLTLLSLTLLGLGGYLLALLMAGRPGDPEGAQRREPLTLAVTTLLLTLTEGVAIALLLGALGFLRLELALALQTLLVYGLHRRLVRRGWQDSSLAEPLRLALRRTWSRLREYPALALIAVHAVGSEVLRGLLRPPLSWDSLMYHLYLAATWLQQGSFDLVAARQPTAAYLFMPSEGSLWLWWWMAPSHSELYVNLASVPAWVLLGLAAGAFARELGARRHWPVAAFLTVLTPAVLRFVATQYVDVLVAAALVSGSLFAVRWLRRPTAPDAVLVGVAVGLAAGAKVVGLAFGLALAGLVLVLALTRTLVRARGEWRRRLGHAAIAALLALLLGGYFYARNVAVGGGLFGDPCVQQDPEAEGGVLGSFPIPDSIADAWLQGTGEGLLADAFLGSTRPTLSDLGVGPVVFLLLAAVLVLPFAVPRERRSAAWLVPGQVGAQLAFWLLVPYAANAHVLANVRYLDTAVALAFAGAVALAEGRLSDGWIRGLALAVAVQDLLMLHAVLPRQVRWLLAAILVGAAAAALSPRLREVARRRRKPILAAAAVVVVVATPPFAAFRAADRGRAFAQELTAHLTSSRFFAAGWEWLDENAGTGTVAVSHAPQNYFVYPAMGPFLERRAVYVHVNRQAHDNPLRYPGCDPRVDLSPEAWLENLRREEVRWLHVARFPEMGFPVEDGWARARPDLFALRFDHPTNRVYEVAGAPPEQAE